MRHAPSIIPGADHDTYLVQEDYGRLGRCWRETDVEDTDLERVIAAMLEGQQPGPGDQLQHGGGMVTGRVGGCSARAAAALLGSVPGSSSIVAAVHRSA